MPWIGFVIPGRRNDRRRLAPPIVARVSTDEVRQLRARLDDPRRRPARPPVKGLRSADPDKVGRIAEPFAAAEALVATREALLATALLRI
jgi:hypothetical protein